MTPFRMSSFEFAEVKRVCQTCTFAGFTAMYEAGPARPFRFIYFSAEGTPFDLSKKPRIMGDYQIMRVSSIPPIKPFVLLVGTLFLTLNLSPHQGETEHMVLDLPKQYKDVEVCIPHPGVVTNSTTWGRAVLASVLKTTNAITFNNGPPNVTRSQLAAAVLEQAVSGFEKQMLTNNDLVRIGTAALKKKY